MLLTSEFAQKIKSPHGLLSAINLDRRSSGVLLANGKEEKMHQMMLFVLKLLEG